MNFLLLSKVAIKSIKWHESGFIKTAYHKNAKDPVNICPHYEIRKTGTYCNWQYSCGGKDQRKEILNSPAWQDVSTCMYTFCVRTRGVQKIDHSCQMLDADDDNVLEM